MFPIHDVVRNLITSDIPAQPAASIDRTFELNRIESTQRLTCTFSPDPTIPHHQNPQPIKTAQTQKFGSRHVTSSAACIFPPQHCASSSSRKQASSLLPPSLFFSIPPRDGYQKRTMQTGSKINKVEQGKDIISRGGRIRTHDEM